MTIVPKEESWKFFNDYMTELPEIRGTASSAASATKLIVAPESLPSELRAGGTIAATIGRDQASGKQGVSVGQQFIELPPPRWEHGQQIIITATALPNGVALNIRPLGTSPSPHSAVAQLLADLGLKAALVEHAMDLAPVQIPLELLKQLQVPQISDTTKAENLARVLEDLIVRQQTPRSPKLDLLVERLLEKFEPATPQSMVEQARQRLLPAIALLQNESQQTKEAIEGLLKGLMERPIAELLSAHAKLEREVVNRLLNTKGMESASAAKAEMQVRNLPPDVSLSALEESQLGGSPQSGAIFTQIELLLKNAPPPASGDDPPYETAIRNITSALLKRTNGANFPSDLLAQELSALLDNNALSLPAPISNQAKQLLSLLLKLEEPPSFTEAKTPSAAMKALVSLLVDIPKEAAENFPLEEQRILANIRTMAKSWPPEKQEPLSVSREQVREAYAELKTTSLLPSSTGHQDPILTLGQIEAAQGQAAELRTVLQATGEPSVFFFPLLLGQSLAPAAIVVKESEEEKKGKKNKTSSTSFQFNCSLPNLGQVVIDCSMERDRAQVVFSCEHQESVKFISENLATLKESLEASSVKEALVGTKPLKKNPLFMALKNASRAIA